MSKKTIILAIVFGFMISALLTPAEKAMADDSGHSYDSCYGDPLGCRNKKPDPVPVVNPAPVVAVADTSANANANDNTNTNLNNNNISINNVNNNNQSQNLKVEVEVEDKAAQKEKAKERAAKNAAKKKRVPVTGSSEIGLGILAVASGLIVAGRNKIWKKSESTAIAR